MAASTKFLALVVSGVLAMSVGLCAAGAHAASGTSGANYSPLTKAESREITSVPPATLAAIGSGARGDGHNTPPGLIHAAALRQHGKPELAYVLAEWCPYCAAESWSVAVALSRFGTFRGLTALTSSATDHPSSIPTMSFRYAHFHSRYLTFDPIVYADPAMKRVDQVPAEVRPAWHRYTLDTFPFLDFGGKAAVDVSPFDPAILKHLTRPQVTAALNQPKRRVAKAVDGTANQLTAAICVMTGGKPGSICKAKVIVTIQRALKPLKATGPGAADRFSVRFTARAVSHRWASR
jgi:hypothetical protein